MYGVTSEFAAAIVSGSQRAVVRAVVLLGDMELGELDIISGSVTVDGRREGALRTLSLTVSPDATTWAWLTTYGAEIKVWRGLTLSGGDELVPLGVFVIDDGLEQTDDGSITINAADRSQRISRARWIDPYAVASGTDVGTAIGAILTDRWLVCPLGFTTLGVVTGAQVVFDAGSESDPWKDAKSLAASAGWDLYFDGNGVVKIRAVPDPTTAFPVASYGSGDLAVVIEETKRASFAKTANMVVATGEGSGVTTPVRGVAMDDDPLSPTYVYGPMGIVPQFLASPLLTTQSSVDQAAATRLARVRGRVEQITFVMLVNPAHDAFDVVDLDDVDATRRFMLDQLTIPLVANEAMGAAARETRVS